MITPPTRTQQQWYTATEGLDAINEISDDTSAASPESSGGERNQGEEIDRESEHIASNFERREREWRVEEAARAKKTAAAANGARARC